MVGGVHRDPQQLLGDHESECCSSGPTAHHDDLWTQHRPGAVGGHRLHDCRGDAGANSRLARQSTRQSHPVRREPTDLLDRLYPVCFCLERFIPDCLSRAAGFGRRPHHAYDHRDSRRGISTRTARHGGWHHGDWYRLWSRRRPRDWGLFDGVYELARGFPPHARARHRVCGVNLLRPAQRP